MVIVTIICRKNSYLNILLFVLKPKLSAQLLWDENVTHDVTTCIVNDEV